MTKVLGAYQLRRDHFGDNLSGILGWRDKESQEIRFDVITFIIKESQIENPSIFDIGSGNAEFLFYWESHVKKPLSRYVGIDIRPFNGVCTHNGVFYVDDITNPSDKTTTYLSESNIIIASGLFSFWNEPLIRTIVKMVYDQKNENSMFIFNHLRKGLGGDNTYVTVPKMVRYICSFTNIYRVIADYSDEDATYVI